ncbi:TPA: hypothetical protein JBB31_10955 [Legionella pneumophila subsp. pneumophila]|nr:hypothetical protein [Legionella pneumophila subsp. pneumophila]
MQIILAVYICDILLINAGILRFYGYFSFFTLYLLWALVIFVKTEKHYLLIEIKKQISICFTKMAKIQSVFK